MKHLLENYLYGLGLRKKLMLVVIIFLSFLVLENAYIIRRDYVILNNYNKDNQDYSKISELKNTLAKNNRFLNEYFEESVLKTTEGFNESTLKILSSYNNAGYEAFEIIAELKGTVKSQDEYLWIQAISNASANYREEADNAIREHNNGIRSNQNKVDKMYKYINVYLDEFLEGTLETREAGYDQLFQQWNNSKNITIILLLTMIIIIYFAGSLFTNYLTDNINRIIKLQGKIGTGDFAGELKHHLMGDEVGQLNKSLNEMQKNIKAQINTLNEKAVMQQRLYQEELINIEMQRALNEAKYAMLQSQINPHFLFNTLNIISRKAMFNGSEEAVRLIKALSELFRHSLIDISKKVSLQKELDVVFEYLYIQQVRFGQRIYVKYINEIEDASNLFLPPLILQPIVENAIIHGLEPLEEDGELLIHVTEENNIVRVVIQDNGIGIDEEELAKIQNNMLKTDSIGLKNVMQRMVYFCDEDSFFIESDARGTRVELRFPRFT